MKRNPLAGTGKVFGFTLRQTCMSKGWLISTILIAALLLCGIPLIFLGIAKAGSSEKDDSEKIKTVIVVDETEGKADYSVLDEELTFKESSSMDAALETAKSDANSVVLNVKMEDGTFLLTAFLPEDTAISRSRAGNLVDQISAKFKTIQLQKAEMSLEAAMVLTLPVTTDISSLEADYDPDAEETDDLKDALSFLIPFLMLMLIYMMVIFYGQSMANSVMLEKTSKLMETMLTAVRPFPLMFGKLLATASAAVLQILIWLGCLIGGLVIGAGMVVANLPSDAMGGNSAENAAVMIDSAVDSLKGGDYIILQALPVALLFLAFGFVLYLSLGAVSGALASKSEDLNKTNIILIFVLLGSFFLCMNLSGPSADDPSSVPINSAVWIRYFPFTALLVDPGELLLGKLSILNGCIALLVMIAVIVLLLIVAAAIYRMLMLYRGNPPTPKALLQMFKDQRAAKAKK